MQLSDNLKQATRELVDDMLDTLGPPPIGPAAPNGVNVAAALEASLNNWAEAILEQSSEEAHGHATAASFLGPK